MEILRIKRNNDYALPGRSRDSEERSFEVTLEEYMVSYAWMLVPISKWQRWLWKPRGL